MYVTFQLEDTIFWGHQDTCVLTLVCFWVSIRTRVTSIKLILLTLLRCKVPLTVRVVKDRRTEKNGTEILIG
jgi:hypothetical protein